MFVTAKKLATLFVIFSITIVAAIPFGCRKKSPPRDQPRRIEATTKPQPTLPSAVAARKTISDQQFESKKVIKKVSDDCRDFMAAGDHALAEGDTDKAIKFFYRAMDVDPTNPDALRGLATALVAAGKYRQVVPVYEMIHGMSPNDRTVMFNMAVALSKTNQFAQAQQVYLDLLNRNPKDVRSRYNLATLYQARGKLVEAAEAWRLVLRDAKNLSSAHTALGEVLTDLGDLHGAMLCYAEAAKLKGDCVHSWLNLSLAAEAAGSFGRAVVAAKRAAKLDPDNAEIFARLGELHLTLHRATGKERFLTEAIHAWRWSLALDPSQKQIRNFLETYEPIVSPGQTEHNN